MLELIILSFMLLYTVIAFVYIRSVWKETSDRRLRIFVVALAILIPYWDFILSATVFFVACPFVPKTSIYETAETEGISYEGYLHDTVYIYLGNKSIAETRTDIKMGYQYAEHLVTKERDLDNDKTNVLPDPVIYRCIENQKEPRRTWWIPNIECFPDKESKSKYVVKYHKYSFLLSRIISVKIYERLTDRLMAEHREISLDSRFPSFFGWLGYGNTPTTFVRYPEKSPYSFPYEVLKLKKSPSGA